ncbi:mechanosensitive ion channel family protein [Robertkochia sediminum]|uniref:mechanosensitive ion channel family protein n=1 Tax=Robertkochia sediminum TaxID=2785326 RepID=UPI001932708C|nr:mechanosensitive ion channel domain-containing protein [Robertkochia sediminum]MBL7472761.1 mechanosensitive ion channel [Robertkochia sediminum]
MVILLYLKRLAKPVTMIILAIALKTLNKGFEVIPEDYVLLINKVSSIMIIFGMSWGAIRMLRLLKQRYLLRHDINIEDNLHARKLHTKLNILERILIFIIITIGVAAVLTLFEGVKKIGVSLFASAGIAGIILGFAAQKAIGTLLAGLQIAISQPIRLDDVLVVEGEWGWVEEIRLTFVVVRIWDKRRLVLPTTYFIEKPFQNWTRNSADLLGTVFIYTDYKIDIDALREELTRLLDEHPLWDRKVNNLQVTNATEKGVELRAMMSASNSPKTWDLRVDIREGLIKYLQKNHPESLPRTRIALVPDNHEQGAAAQLPDNLNP